MSQPSPKKDVLLETAEAPKEAIVPESKDASKKSKVVGDANSAKKIVTQWKQINETHKNFVSTSENYWISQQARDFFHYLADIIEMWQSKACGNEPTDCALSFGSPEVTVTLRQVLALVPERWQWKIALEGTDSGSWLDENLMNAIVQLYVPDTAPDVAPNAHFARCLATDCNMSLDALAVSEGYATRLAYLRNQQEKNLPGWNASGLYTIPAGTDRIICFWNYYENHWSVLSIDIDNEKWNYKIYNSLDCTNEATKHSVSRLGLDLGHLIRSASNMNLPPIQPTMELKPAAQQDNYDDCGVYAVENVISLLKREPVPLHIDPFARRFAYVRKIRWALRVGRAINSAMSKLSPEEQYWWGTLRPMLDQGPRDERTVLLFDKALNKALGPQVRDGDKLAEQLFTCIQTGLGTGMDNEQILDLITSVADHHRINNRAPPDGNASRNGDNKSQS